MRQEEGTLGSIKEGKEFTPKFSKLISITNFQHKGKIKLTERASWRVREASVDKANEINYENEKRIQSAEE